MSYLTVSSPIGELTIFEDAGAIVALEWGRAGEPSFARRSGLREGGSPRAYQDAPLPGRTGEPRKPPALLKRAARQLDEYFAGARKTFDLPFRPAGTAFQRKVWTQLSAIPFGANLTYGALATKLRSGARAVGTACGANPVPILIPCHRVLGADGRLCGYSGEGGVATKQFLLAHEAAPGAKAPKT